MRVPRSIGSADSDVRRKWSSLVGTYHGSSTTAISKRPTSNIRTHSPVRHPRLGLTILIPLDLHRKRLLLQLVTRTPLPPLRACPLLPPPE